MSWRRRLPLALAAGAILVTLAATGLMVSNGDPLVGDSFNLALIIVGTVYAAIGGVVASRLPGNPIGWFFLAAAWIWAANFLLAQYALHGIAAGTGSDTGVTLAGWVSTWLWIPANTLLLFGVPLVFPDGRLPSPRWRPLVILTIAACALMTAGQAVAGWAVRGDLAYLLGPDFDSSNTPGPLGLLVSVGNLIVFIFAPVAALAALVGRFRSSQGVVRVQMRWFVAGVAAAIPLVLGDILMSIFLPSAVGLLGAIGLTIIPVTLGISILRYRLYDLDRLVSRTIAYALVTGLLLAIFGGSILLLETILAPFTERQTIPVAASTLAVFALFQPVMRRVRRRVDRRFDRARYDGERTAAAFSERLRDEIDLTTISADLGMTVGGAISPSTQGIWLRGREARR